MKRFEFRLDRVLEWRRTQLERELAALGVLVAEAQAIERRRAEILAERAAAERSLIDAGGAESAELAALDRFRGWVARESERLLARRAEWEAKIDQQRAAVLEARRRCRLLEKLREIRKAEWGAELNREMENLAGELYLVRRTSSVARST